MHVVTSPGVGAVEDLPSPTPGPGQVLIDVEQVGVCGTDMALFQGTAARLESYRTTHPLRLGHEWCGAVAELGEGVDPAWLGQRVSGDTMIGCGSCRRCRTGRHHVCADRVEVGVRGGFAGALAEQFLMPTSALHRLPDTVTADLGALVEPGANALRAVDATGVAEGDRLLVLGAGSIALLCAQFALARGADVHVVGLREPSLRFARDLGVHGAWTRPELPDLPWDAVIDATDGHEMPAFASEVVEPTGRLVYIGLSTAPSLVDSRDLVRKDVTAVGVLGGSAALAGTIAAYADGLVDPRPLVGDIVSLDEVSDVLGGKRQPPSGAGPKVHVNMRR